MTNRTNESDKNISENDELHFDPGYSVAEIEPDDTSTDEYISKEDDSLDSNSTE